ncbi:MAG: hypothetical protein MUP25_02235, partial [Syntrophales bacterium]|nr:hypothetical protein [Syntrophales bacterium]
KAAFDAKTDKKGPFTIGAQVEIKLTPPKAEPARKGVKQPAPPEGSKTFLVVFGDADFAANSFFNLFGNGDLFLNTTNFLARAMEQITVRGAGKAQLLSLKTGQIWALFLVCLAGAPLVMLAAGIWAYRRRRARR